jgi:protein-S-isoprenylcysteine O-methyltransferase Ste14
MNINDKSKSLVLDILQVSSLIFFVLTGPLLPKNIFVLFFEANAIALILSAVWEMRRNKFYRVPDIGKQDSLVKSGIYKYIRHPMYTSQILLVGTLLVNYFALPRLLVFAVLFFDFLGKVKYEEKLLDKHFSEYADYQKKSFRLVPFIY